MKLLQLRSGFSLIELLVVIAIIAILTTVALISFAKNKSQVSVDSFLELFHDQMILFQSEVSMKKLEKAEIFLSVETPRSYQIFEKKLFSDQQNKSVAQNMELSSVQDASVLSSGVAQISWGSPENGNTVSFIVLGNNAEISRQSGLTSPQIITPLSEYRHYAFRLENDNNLQSGETLHMYYFSQENISSEERFPVQLVKIEGQQFSGDWIEIDDVHIKIVHSSGKIFIFSQGDSFLNVRFTFEKQDYSTVYELL